MADEQPAVLVQVEGSLGHLTLNRPKAINALDLAMVRLIDAALTAWEHDNQFRAVLIDGAGERGLCAGGDIRAIYDAAKAGAFEPVIDFWREEYRLNARLAKYPKPVVAFMDGIVMGGGVGISAHGSHRVVTETTMLAMPETGIGFIPDVGGTYLLSRAPGELGTHAGLTAGRYGAADAILLGFADDHVPRAELGALVEALRGCGSAADVDRAIAAVATNPAAGKLAGAQSWIDRAYAADEVETIIERLAALPADEGSAALTSIGRNSPTSLKVTLRALREARRLGSLEPCLAMELRLGSACIRGHDMPEGIRAAVVDKDRNPRWEPARVEDVTQETVERHFGSIGPNELDFKTA